MALEEALALLITVLTLVIIIVGIAVAWHLTSKDYGHKSLKRRADKSLSEMSADFFKSTTDIIREATRHRF